MKRRPYATRADGRPAYEVAPPRLRQSHIDRFGSAEAARKALTEGRAA